MKQEKSLLDYLEIPYFLDEQDNILQISSNASREVFLEKVYLFIKMQKSIYYRDGIMLLFDDRLVTFNYDFEFLDTLYNLSKKYNLNKIKEYISDFLLSYQFSLKSKFYTEESIISNKLEDAFYKYFGIEDFYGHGRYIQEGFSFFSNFIIQKYITGEDHSFILFDRYLPMYSQRLHNTSQFSEIFSRIYTHRFTMNLIKYDELYKSHKEYYNSKLHELITGMSLNSYSFDKANKYIKTLNNKKILKKSVYIEMVNFLIKETNIIIQQFNNEDLPDIETLANIQSIIESVDIIKQSEFASEYVSIFDEMLKKILFIKRKYIKNDEFKKSFSSVEAQIELSQDEAKRIKELIHSNFSNIYLFLNIDFDIELQNAIITHSDYPIVDLAKHYSLIKDQGIYLTEVEEKNIFSTVYNAMGVEYTNQRSKDLKNKYDGDFFTLLIRYVNSNVSLRKKVIYHLLKDEIESNLIEYINAKIFEQSTMMTNNPHILLSILIIQIEKLIYEDMQKYNLDYKSDNMSYNLKLLFEYFKNNRSMRNKYMNIYYILYFKDGLNIRNNHMHGNSFILSEDLIDLLFVFTCFIIMLKPGE